MKAVEMLNVKRLIWFLATGEMPEMTALDESLAEHDKKHHPNGYKEGDECNKRAGMAGGDGVDSPVKRTVCWMSQNADWRLRNGWTFRPEGVSDDELHALAAIVPEKHHVGSESHGNDVILQEMYPADYAEWPEVAFVKQFNGNKDDLSIVRKALYLMYGGNSGRRYFERYVDPEGYSKFWHERKPSEEVSKKVAEINDARAKFEKTHGVLSQRELEDLERRVYARRQAIQHEIGYPDYKDSDEWKNENGEYMAIRSYRIGDDDIHRQLQKLLDKEEKRAKDEWMAGLGERYAKYKEDRFSRGLQMLDDLAELRGVVKWGEKSPGRTEAQPGL